MTHLYLTQPDTTKVQFFSNTGQWIVQETNPVNNQHLQVMDSEAVPDPTSADAENTVPLDMVSKKPVLVELHTERFTLDNWKYYLDSCAKYHTFLSGSY